MKKNTIELPTLFGDKRIYFLEESPESSGLLKFVSSSELSEPVSSAYIFVPFKFNGKLYIRGNQALLAKNDIIDYFDS